MEKVEKQMKNSGKEKKIKSKISVILICLIVLAIIVGVVLLVLNIGKKEEEEENYTQSVKAYGFDKLYNDVNADGSTSVTKSEAIKLIIAATINRDDITEILNLEDIFEGYDETKDVKDFMQYDNELWVEYAKAAEIISSNEITKENENNTVEYIDVITYLANAKTKILNKNLDTTTDEIKNIDTLNVSAQLALKDMVYNQIVTNTKANWRKNATKNDVNALIVKFVNKYNTITLNGEKLNINQDKAPSNEAEYPYILATVKKEVYEIKNYITNETEYKNPKELYTSIKDDYDFIGQITTEYLNTLLNIDYEKTNLEEFESAIFELTLGTFATEDMDNYKEYIVENKIKMTGEAKVQYPAIYYDGTSYRVRAKATLNVESAEKLVNLLFMDLGKEQAYTYKTGANEMIIDLPLQKAVTYDYMYIEPVSLNDNIAGNIK